jgi:hypothetical protein
MTMVTPLHLLLFGALKIEYTKEFVQLDNWYVMVDGGQLKKEIK